jgi:PAS domain S-box-containing protein
VSVWRVADWPLRTKLAALVIAASLLPVVFATAFDIRDSRGLLLRQSGALLESRADQLAGELDSFNTTYQQVSDRLARLPEVTQTSGTSRMDSRTLQNLLAVLPRSDPAVIATALLDARGTVEAASNPGLVGASLMRYDFIQKALQDHAAGISDVYVGAAPMEAVATIAFAAPLSSDGGPVTGLAIVWVRAAQVWALMRASNQLAGAGSFAALFDELGIRIGHSYSSEIVFHPAAVLAGATLEGLVAQQRYGPRTRELLQDARPFPELYTRAIGKSLDAQPFSGQAPVVGKRIYGVGKRLHTVPWTVFYMVPEDSLLAQVDRMVRRQLLFAGLIALLGLAGGFAFASSILRPVRSLSRATEDLAVGKLTTRAVVNGTDEIGRLGRGFNVMAERIETQATALQRAHTELEAKVRARTAELERTTHQLKAEAEARTRAEEASRVSRELLEQIVQSSDDAIISKSVDGLITSWNRGAEKLFGYSAREAIGQPVLMLFPPERAAEEREILARISRGERVEHFETVRVRADKSRIEISATISPITDGHGRIVGASKIARDITERKLQERRLGAQLERLALLQQTTRGIADRQDLQSIFQVLIGTLESQLPIDFGAVCLYGSASRRLIVSCVGPRSAALARDMRLSEHVELPADQNGLAECLRGRLVYEPELAEVHYPFARTLFGQGLRSLVIAPLAFESQVFGVLIAARHAAGAFSSGECEFLRQVTEHAALAAQHAKLYAALQTAYEDLRRTQEGVMQQERLRVLGQMASGIAHDINNAISPVTLYTELLLGKEQGLSAQARQYLQLIHDSVLDVAATVARLREFYRERDPQAVLEPVDLNAQVTQVLELTRARWSNMALQKGIVIRIQTELAPDLPAIMGSASEIRDALTNLIVNAVDALPAGGTITVTTYLGAAQDECLEIRDSGVGMDEATRLRCLEPFFTTKGEAGTGLGLAMVYGTVQRHGAEMEIESAPNSGTMVRVRFPLSRRDSTSGAAATRTPDSLPAQLRLLVVDDDPIVLNSLRDALQSYGHTVVTANGGHAGIEAFRLARDQGEPFAAVITDLGMPYVDGQRVASAVKALEPATPVILLTGWGQRLLAEDGVPADVDRVVSKPPRLREIQSALAELTSSGSQKS